MLITSQLLLLVVWGAASGAPAMENENMIKDNTTSHCFQDVLQEKLKMQFEMCLQNNSGASTGTPMVKDVFLCALKAEDMVNEDDIIDLTKLKMSDARKEEDKTDDEKNDMALKMAVEKCEMDEDTKDGKANEFAECIVENIGLNCTRITAAEDGMVMEEGA